jgi:hypothetical protein
MYTQNFKFPVQRLSYKEKAKDNFLWARETIDALSDNFIVDEGLPGVSNTDEDYKRKLANYRLYNNIIDMEQIRKECDPMGLDVGQFKDEVFPYNKAPNKVDIQLGEEYKRRVNFKAITINEDGIRSKQVNQTEAVRNVIYQKMNDLAETIKMRYLEQSQQMDDAQRQQLEQEIQQQLNELQDPQEIKKLSNHDFMDYKEKAANNLLKWIFYSQDIKDKMNDGFKHGLISGGEYIWVESSPTVGPKYKVLNSLGVMFHKSPDLKFIQDGLYCGYRTMMSIGDTIDEFGEYLSKEDYDDLVDIYMYSHNTKVDSYGNIRYEDDDRGYYNKVGTSDEGNYGPTNSFTDVLVERYEWRSQKKIYYVTLTDPYTGEEQKLIANENYVIPNDAKRITRTKRFNKKETVYIWEGGEAAVGWIDEIWQGVKIDGDKYCMIGPREYQYRPASDPNNIQLSMHGAVYNNTNASSISLMDRIRPFQYLYFIVAHKLKKLIAKDKGQVFHLDSTMIPKDIGLDKTLYYLNELDIDIFNPLQNAEMPGAAQRGKVTGSTSRSNTQHIMNYIQLLDAIDQQISDVAGISKGREGQTHTTQAVTTAQQDLMQSATITEAIYFAPHYKIWEKALNFGLQCMVSHIQNGKLEILKQYILDDLTVATINVSHRDLAEYEFGVFVSNFAKDNEVFETVRQLAHSFIQNDKMTASDIVKAIKATSTQELEEQIVQSEKDRIEQQQTIQQQQLEAQKSATEAQLLEAEKDRNLKRELALLDAETTIKAKEIDVFKFQQDQDSNNDGVPDPLQIEELKTKKDIENRKLDLEEKKLKIQKEIEEKKIKQQSYSKNNSK